MTPTPPPSKPTPGPCEWCGHPTGPPHEFCGPAEEAAHHNLRIADLLRQRDEAVALLHRWLGRDHDTKTKGASLDNPYTPTKSFLASLKSSAGSGTDEESHPSLPLVFLQVVLVGELLMLEPNFGCDPHYLSTDGLQSCLSQAPEQQLLGACLFIVGVAFIAATATYSFLHSLRLVHPNGVTL